MGIRIQRKTTVISAIVLLLISLLLVDGGNIFNQVNQRLSSLMGNIEGCYSPDGLNITKRKTIGSNWGGSSGIVMDNGSIILGGLDFSDRSGIKDEQTNYSIKDVGFLKSDDGWHFSKFKPTITNLNKTIMACGDPTIVKLPEGGYRMYLTDGEKGCHGKAAPLLSAYSKDGLSYSFEGELTGDPGINREVVDFTVLYEKKSGKYYIYTRTDSLGEADVLETTDGRHITKRFRIKIPFGFQFSILDKEDRYVAYGQHLPSDSKPNSNLRYPVRATSRDGLNWEQTPEQPSGSWDEDRTYCGTYAVLKLPDGHYFY